MKNYMIWNKTDKINGVNAEYFIEELKIREDDEVFLIGDSLGAVYSVEISRIIKQNYNLNSNLSVEEVAQAYVSILKQREEQANKHTLFLEESEKKISILEEENKKLKEVTKDQDNLLVDNAYKITILEMNLGGK